MQYPKLTAMLLALAVAMAEYVVIPHGIVGHLLDAPRYVGWYLEWKREQNEWDAVLERSARHEPEAMYEVAMAMENGFYGRYAMIRVSGQSRDLIRGAAAGGYVPARIRVWQTDGGTAEELHAMLIESGHSGWGEATLSQTTVEWRETALRDCYAPLYDREKVYDTVYGHGRRRPGQSADSALEVYRLDDGPLVKAESLFVQKCGFSPWPAG